MDQDTVCRLKSLSKQLDLAVQRLGEHAVSPGGFSFTGELRTDKESVDVRRERERAKACALAVLADMKALICEPGDLLQQLACQIEVLACIQWLAEYQILACIPANNSVAKDRSLALKQGRNIEPEQASIPIKDLADLAGVPQTLLTKIIRLASTSGFLQEVQPGFVAHTRLSSPFLADHSFLDAATFLANSIAPAALHMVSGLPSTQQQQQQQQQGPRIESYLFNNGSARGNGGVSPPSPFHVARQERPKLNRQWIAYLRHAAGLCQAEEIAEMLARLNWANISNACIVEVNAASTELAESLLDLRPMLNVVVQITVDDNTLSSLPGNAMKNYTFGPSNSSTKSADLGAAGTSSARHGGRAATNNSSRLGSGGRITITRGSPGQPQTVMDAAVYILHLPSAPAPGENLTLVSAQLQDHLGILRGNGGLLIILTPRVLPEPGMDRSIEAIARARDLAMIQLADGCEMEVAEFTDMINATKDGNGRLVVMHRLRSRDGLLLAVAVKYQAWDDSSLIPLD